MVHFWGVFLHFGGFMVYFLGGLWYICGTIRGVLVQLMGVYGTIVVQSDWGVKVVEDGRSWQQLPLALKELRPWGAP